MTPVELPNGREVVLRPGDAVALIHDVPITAKEAEHIREQWQRALPGIPVVILSGLEVTVLRREDA